MIISHKHRYIFVQTPHTACTAVASHLKEHLDGEDILWKHAMRHHLERHPEIDVSKYFVFSTVRNPFSEVFSVYNKFKTDHEGYSDPANWSVNGGWLSKRGLAQFRFIHDHQATFADYIAKYLRLPYVNWTVLAHKQFNHVMRFERLAEDFNTVATKLNLPDCGPIPHVNPTKKNPVEEVRTNRQLRRNLVYSLSPMMEFWDYEFPPETELQRETSLTSRTLFKVCCKARKRVWLRRG